MSIMTWRALAPKVSEVVLTSGDVCGAADCAKLDLSAPTIATIAVVPLAAKILRLDIIASSSFRCCTDSDAALHLAANPSLNDS